MPNEAPEGSDPRSASAQVGSGLASAFHNANKAFLTAGPGDAGLQTEPETPGAALRSPHRCVRPLIRSYIGTRKGEGAESAGVQPWIYVHILHDLKYIISSAYLDIKPFRSFQKQAGLVRQGLFEQRRHPVQDGGPKGKVSRKDRRLHGVADPVRIASPHLTSLTKP